MKEENVGQKIRNLRKSHKDTLISLAEKTGYDWSSLSKIERGIRYPSVDLLKRITNLYMVDPKYFFSEGFTQSEGHLLIEEDLSPSKLKEKYDFVVDGIKATDEEIKEAIRLIRQTRETEEAEDEED